MAEITYPQEPSGSLFFDSLSYFYITSSADISAGAAVVFFFKSSIGLTAFSEIFYLRKHQFIRLLNNGILQNV